MTTDPLVPKPDHVIFRTLGTGDVSKTIDSWINPRSYHNIAAFILIHDVQMNGKDEDVWVKLRAR